MRFVHFIALASLAGAAYAPGITRAGDLSSTELDGEDYSQERCIKEWRSFITTMPEADIVAMCSCIENEIKNSPLEASKGGKLSGPGGLDNAGPWPKIMQRCIFASHSAGEKNADN